MAEQVGQEYGRAMAAGAHRRRRLAGRAALAALGACRPSPTRSPRTASPPTPTQRNDQLRIINNHCPFGDVAIEHPVICAVDRGHGQGDARRALRRRRRRGHRHRVARPAATPSAPPPSEPTLCVETTRVSTAVSRCGWRSSARSGGRAAAPGVGFARGDDDVVPEREGVGVVGVGGAAAGAERGAVDLLRAPGTGRAAAGEGEVQVVVGRPRRPRAATSRARTGRAGRPP